MRFEKDFIGEQSMENHTIRYYVISKTVSYGIAIEEESKGTIACDYIYFTESKEFAYTVAERMNRGMVTLVTMTDVIDDLIA